MRAFKGVRGGGMADSASWRIRQNSLRYPKMRDLVSSPQIGAMMKRYLAIIAAKSAKFPGALLGTLHGALAVALNLLSRARHFRLDPKICHIACSGIVCVDGLQKVWSRETVGVKRSCKISVDSGDVVGKAHRSVERRTIPFRSLRHDLDFQVIVLSPHFFDQFR